jgi:hypothetical protein
VAWNKLLSIAAWIKLFREHPLCAHPPLLLCLPDRGAWLHIATLAGAAVAIVTRRGDIRAAACAMIAYTGLEHLYEYALEVDWLGPASVLSKSFWALSSWPFMFMFAAFPFTEATWLLVPGKSRSPLAARAAALASVAVNTALVALLVVTVVHLFGNPYGTYQYRAYRIAAMAAAIGLLTLAVANISPGSRLNALFGFATRGARLRQSAILAVLPILAVLHLSYGTRLGTSPIRDASLRNYLQVHAAIAPEQPFRGYTTTIWEDKTDKINAAPKELLALLKLGASALYFNARPYFLARYGETFTETDLWQLDVPTIEEYAEWTSAQAYAFLLRLLAPKGMQVHSNYLRVHMIDTDILRLIGARFVITDAAALDKPAPVRVSLSAPDALNVRLFELSDVNLGTYSPRRFEKATTADEIAQRIRENKSQLNEVAIVSEDLPPTTEQARNVVISVSSDGIRVRAQSDGPAHTLLPIQFSHCLVVVNDAAVRLSRANLFQTLISFSGSVDAQIELRFGLFADNACRLRDGADNKALGL